MQGLLHQWVEEEVASSEVPSVALLCILHWCLRSKSLRSYSSQKNATVMLFQFQSEIQSLFLHYWNCQSPWIFCKTKIRQLNRIFWMWFRSFRECFAKKYWRMRNLSIQTIFIMGTRYTATINSLVGPLYKATNFVTQVVSLQFMSKTCNESCNWTNISDVRFMGDVVITSFSLGLLNNLERPKKCTYVVCTQMQVRLIE